MVSKRSRPPTGAGDEIWTIRAVSVPAASARLVTIKMDSPTGPAPVMFSESETKADLVGVPESATRNSKAVLADAAWGMPISTPVRLFSVSPAGSVPVTDQV